METLYKRVTSADNVRLAIEFTLEDYSKDHFYNPIQLIHCRQLKDHYFDRVMELMAKPGGYKPRVALRILHKKSEHAYRNYIVQDIEDAIIRTAIAIVLADEMEDRLIDNCFGSRRGEQKVKNKTLTEDFSEFAWDRYCKWQNKCFNRYPLLLITDISSFFDSICHDLLLLEIRDQFGLSAKDSLIKLMHNVLKVSHIISVRNKPTEIRHGITVGLQANHIFANLYLNRIDHIMNAIPGISYGRYVDDMRIFGKYKEIMDVALATLQARLFELGLNLNGAKTKYAGDKKILKRLLSDYVFNYCQPDIKGDVPEVPSAIIELQDKLDKFEKSKVKEIDTPLTQIHPYLDAWKGRRILGDAKRITAWLHSAQTTIDFCPKMLTKAAVRQIFRIIRESPKNQKFAAWLIIRIVADSRYSEKNRLQILEKLFDILLEDSTSIYVVMRTLINMSKPGPRYRFNFDLIDEATGKALKDKFLRIVQIGLDQDTLIAKIVSLYALVVYNLLHEDQPYVCARLEEIDYEHSVIAENIGYLKDLAGGKRINMMIKKKRK